MNTPGWWQHQNITAQLLRPLSALWLVASAIRRVFSKPEKLTIPVWCVGNAVAGGGGKTPFCLHLAELIKQTDIHAYFICRGYGGAQRGPLLVNPAIHQARDVGDEALLLAHSLPTIIGRSRLKAAKMAQARGAQLIIMDDGMQYPHLIKDLIFLMLKGNQPWGNGYMIPAGPLREPMEQALARSQILVYMDRQLPAMEEQPSHTTVLHAATMLSFSSPVYSHAIAFAGIAQPEHFEHSLKNAGIEVIEFHRFADHYAYTSAQVDDLIDRANQLQAVLITTQKDAVKISAKQRHHIIIADQSLLFSAEDTDQLTQRLYALKN